MTENIYSVTEVNSFIKDLLEGEPELRNVQVMGEISNFKRYPSGHCYFTLKDAGATRIFAGCTHAVLSGPAIERLDKSVIDKLVMLDTVSLPDEKMLPKFKILSVADIFAAAIENVYLDKPMSKLYD